MKISKLCKYAVVPAAILILSQTGIGKAVADTLTPAAVSSTASVGQTAQKGTTASTAKTATKAQGDSVSGDGWTIIPGIPGDGTRAATAATAAIAATAPTAATAATAATASTAPTVLTCTNVVVIVVVRVHYFSCYNYRYSCYPVFSMYRTARVHYAHCGWFSFC